MSCTVCYPSQKSQLESQRCRQAKIRNKFESFGTAETAAETLKCASAIQYEFIPLPHTPGKWEDGTSYWY
jgi:hypothetical protein